MVSHDHRAMRRWNSRGAVTYILRVEMAQKQTRAIVTDDLTQNLLLCDDEVTLFTTLEPYPHSHLAGAMSVGYVRVGNRSCHWNDSV